MHPTMWRERIVDMASCSTLHLELEYLFGGSWLVFYPGRCLENANYCCWNVLRASFAWYVRNIVSIKLHICLVSISIWTYIIHLFSELHCMGLQIPLSQLGTSFSSPHSQLVIRLFGGSWLGAYPYEMPQESKLLLLECVFASFAQISP